MGGPTGLEQQHLVARVCRQPVRDDTTPKRLVQTAHLRPSTSPSSGSIYFRDPNGYVIELTASTGKHSEIMDPAISKPHEALAHWQAMKGDRPRAPGRGDRRGHRRPRCRGAS
jgi:hypothetical protein